MSDDKTQLREEIRKRRREQTSTEKEQRTAAIIRNLQDFPAYQEAQTIFFYHPTAEEVNLLPLAREALKDGKKLYFPIMSEEDHGLHLAQVQDLEQDLKPGEFGIYEPQQQADANPLDVDIFLIPGVAFDTKGNRLGMGKGYFDKFFAYLEAQDPEHASKRIGIAFDFQILGEVPTSEHDKTMAYVVTDQTIYKA